MAGKKILVAGILDTKGEEIKFLAKRVKAAGGNPTILELSVGHEVGWADISLSDVVSLVGKKKEEIFALDRNSASDLITAGAIKLVDELYNWKGRGSYRLWRFNGGQYGHQDHAITAHRISQDYAYYNGLW